MDKQITFRSMDHSAAIENYINEHIQRIEQFLANEKEPIFIAIVLEPSKTHAHHRVEVRVKSPEYDKICDFEGPEFYKLIDKCLDTMLHNLREKKRELIDKRKS
ncbi:MAG: HPF/RaiA family ribosome-associated protein [Candidatus Babeliales bacterium]